MKINMLVVIGLSFLLSACATSMPKNPEDQATYWIDNARSSLSKNDSHNAGYQIANALELPTGGAKAKELLAGQPIARNYFYAHMEKEIDRIYNINQANAIFQLIARTKDAALLSENQIGELLAKLRNKVVEGSLSGEVIVSIGDDASNFPELNSADHRRAVIDSTIKKLQSNRTGDRPVAALMKHAQSVGRNSSRLLKKPSIFLS